MANITNRWIVLGLMFLIGLTIPMQFQTVPALAPYLVAETDLSYTDIGLLTGIFMFPGVLLAVPGGLLVARIGDKWALTSGLAIMLGSAVLFAVSDSYGLMLFSRLLAGSGAVLVTILLPKVVTDWFAGKEIATAMATIASSFGLGVGLAMAILPFIAELTSWSGAVVANAATIVLAIVFLLTTFGIRETDSGEGKKLPGLWQVNRREFILSVLAGIGYGLFATGYVVFMAFLPTLLIAQGMHAVEAGLTTSLAAAASLVSVPLGGVLSDKTGKPNHFIVGGALGTALTCFFVPYFAPTLLWILLFGFLRGGCTGGIMALPSQVLRPESRSNGFAVSSAVYFSCMAAFPLVGGLLLDITADAAAALWLAGALWLGIPVQLLVFKVLQHKWNL